MRVASTYGTVSEPAEVVIARVIPIVCQEAERKFIYLRKGERNKRAADCEGRAHPLSAWQYFTERESWGGWTAHFTKNGHPCFNRKHKRVDSLSSCSLNQLLRGHGNFQSFLLTIGKSRSSECIYCKDVEGLRHLLLLQKEGAPSPVTQGCQVSPDTIIEVIVQSEDT